MEKEEQRTFAGIGGFVWWTGIVEDRFDPLKLGRCRVRCIGWHTDNKQLLPTEMLPWALPSNPVNKTETYAPKEGDMVFGFFADNEHGQVPIMVGIFPNIPLSAANPKQGFSDPRDDGILTEAPRPPKSKEYKRDGSGIVITEEDKAKLYPRDLDEPTTSRLARNDSEYMSKTFIQERKDQVEKDVPTVLSKWTEPTTEYNTKYPYNNVNETESGHILELDDTFGKERIHLAHRNGSFQEWFPNGDKVEKVTKNNYQIIMADDHVYIMGDCQVTIQGQAEVYIQKDAWVRVDGNADVDVKKNAHINVDGNVDVEVGGNYTEKVGGTYKVQSGGNMSFNAPRIDLN